MSYENEHPVPIPRINPATISQYIADYLTANLDALIAAYLAANPPDVDAQIAAYLAANLDALIATYFAGVTSRCRVTRAAAQTIPNAADTAVSFDTERWDTDGIHNGVNPTRLTCIKAGYYLIVGSISWTASAVGIRYTWVKKNGTTFIAGLCSFANDAVSMTRQIASVVEHLDAGDYIELIVNQTSGGNLDATKSGAPHTCAPEFMIELLK
jgi:hypothetical protein